MKNSTISQSHTDLCSHENAWLCALVHIWNMKGRTCIYAFIQTYQYAHTLVFVLRSGKPKRSGKPRPQAFAAVGNAASVVIQIYGGNARNSKREKVDEKKILPPAAPFGMFVSRRREKRLATKTFDLWLLKF